jgi:hypothetical protein
MAKVDDFFKKSKKEDNSQIYASSDTKEKKQARKPVGWKAMLTVLGALIFLGSLGSAGYFYYKYRKVITNPASVSQDESKSIVEKIKKYMDLPDEQPTLATVADREKLKDQLFFSSAQNGDKVLIFPKSQKAVLYRPSTDRVIEMTSLIGGSAAPAPAPAVQNSVAETPPPAETQPAETKPEEQPQPAETTQQETKKVAVVVYNGTSTKGLAGKIASKVTDAISAEDIKTGNAKGNYKKTLVVDLSGSNNEAVTKIIGVIGGEKGDLPVGETRPEADILIIAGSDIE